MERVLTIARRNDARIGSSGGRASNQMICSRWAKILHMIIMIIMSVFVRIVSLVCGAMRAIYSLFIILAANAAVGQCCVAGKFTYKRRLCFASHTSQSARILFCVVFNRIAACHRRLRSSVQTARVTTMVVNIFSCAYHVRALTHLELILRCVRLCSPFFHSFFYMILSFICVIVVSSIFSLLFFIGIWFGRSSFSVVDFMSSIDFTTQ